MASNRKHSTAQTVIRLLFVVYVFLMLWLLFGQRFGTQVYTQQLARSLNFRPFATVGMYLKLLRSHASEAFWRHAIVNLAGNVVMFVPLGFFLPSIFSEFRGFFATFFFSLLLIALVEVVQYFTMLGACDIDDLILNMMGICIGYLLSKLKQH